MNSNQILNMTGYKSIEKFKNNAGSTFASSPI